MKYDWKDAGEEWSESWGTSAAQWSGTIWPRIKDWLPASTILEIGPGYGRWTHYLKNHCERLIVVDRAPECIEACKQRFANEPKVSSFVNQGGSLGMIADHSVDFVFSFDVFVHIRRDVVEQYLREFRRTLKIGGRGFIHHSNLGAYSSSQEKQSPKGIRKLLTKWRVLDEDYHRTPTMSAQLFRSLSLKYGMPCLQQELINWRGRRLIDCFSWFERADATGPGATRIVQNPNFMKEAAAIKRAAMASNPR